MQTVSLFACVYVLVDPRTGDLRYVGWTTRTLHQRLMSHLRDKDDNNRTRWIQALLKRGTRPVIRLVQQVLVADGPVAERYWISFFRADGCVLVNGTDGGDGTVGWTHSPEARTKIGAAHRGKTLSVAHRTRLREAHVGKFLSQAQRAALSTAHTGKVFTAAHRANIAAAKQGKQRSAVTIAKMRASVTGRKASLETRRKISEANKARHARKKGPP